MLGIKLICVGRLKEKFYLEAFEEYRKRLGRFCRFELCELSESGDLEKEGAAVLAAVPQGSYAAAMCVEGELLSSEDLAALLRRCALEGRSRLCFIIGGSEGLSPAVKERAQLRLSMSPMTFPHHLARVMLSEQLYRAFTILEGSKYHK